MIVAHRTLNGEPLHLMPALCWDKKRARRWRDSAIVALNQNQVDEEVIALIFNLHLSTVYRILDRVPESAQERCSEILDLG